MSSFSISEVQAIILVFYVFDAIAMLYFANTYEQIVFYRLNVLLCLVISYGLDWLRLKK